MSGSDAAGAARRPLRLRSLLQYARFLIVGALATGTHVLLYWLLVSAVRFQPLVANVAAFGVAFVVSFSGHYWWTFLAPVAPTRALLVSVLRFSAVAAFGLGLNSLFVVLTTDAFGAGYLYAIPPMAILTPLSTFLLSKYWAFRSGDEDR